MKTLEEISAKKIRDLILQKNTLLTSRKNPRNM